MPKKAVSPVVAVVILIALAIAVGGMVSSWLASFVFERTQQDTCAISTMYTILQASYNGSSGGVDIKLKNTGKDDLYNFTVEVDNGTVIASTAAYSPVSTYRLGPGKTQYVLANISDQNMTTADTVAVLVGSCLSYSPSPRKVTNI